MEISSTSQTLLFFALNLGYAITALVVSVIALLVIDKVVYRNIDFIEEIKKGNIAAAIFQSTLFVFIGIVVAISLS